MGKEPLSAAEDNWDTKLIDMEEPLTLSRQQLSSLRETVLKVINTHTKKEAEKIFLAGSEPANAGVGKASHSEKVNKPQS